MNNRPLPIRYKLFSYILVTYFPTYHTSYKMSYQGETKYCSVYVHPQLSHNQASLYTEIY
jgi:hypothetical protein